MGLCEEITALMITILLGGLKYFANDIVVRSDFHFVVFFPAVKKNKLPVVLGRDCSSLVLLHFNFFAD